MHIVDLFAKQLKYALYVHKITQRQAKSQIIRALNKRFSTNARLDMVFAVRFILSGSDTGGGDNQQG